MLGWVVLEVALVLVLVVVGEKSTWKKMPSGR